jgi:predicted nucleotidyltransferase
MQVTTSIAKSRTDIAHEPYLSQIKAILEQVFSPRRSGASFGCEIYLFGSRATDRYRDASDFDVGVLASKNIDRELAVARELLEASNIPFIVDLVDLNTTSEEFVRQVQDEGILLWES